ncbi:hypothetical protein HMPREF1316_2660 [Olsenella profusa F0195]|uniref:Uncharacterized protein n=1 Tax=Olsenella profusa F0195 TaxID=1125712 RepID=U2VCN6_9ACTN|nr:hypothetical protein HMPREF1316_2660 [Olsenella profusa F0195]
MALPLRGAKIICEYRVDPLRYLVGGTVRPLLADWRLGRHVLDIRVLRNGVPAETRLPGYAGPRDTISIHPPGILLPVRGHGHAPFLLLGGSCQRLPPEGKHSYGRAPDASGHGHKLTRLLSFC